MILFFCLLRLLCDIDFPFIRTLPTTQTRMNYRSRHGRTVLGKDADHYTRSIELARQMSAEQEQKEQEQKKQVKPPISQGRFRRRSSTGSMLTTELPTVNLIMGKKSIQELLVGGRPVIERLADRRTRTTRGRRSSCGGRTILEIPSEEKSIDAVLADINPFGRFQQVLLLLLFCGAAPIIGFHAFVLEVQSIIPSWRCLDAGCLAETRYYTYAPYHPNTSRILCSLERDQWEWDAVLFNSVSQWDIACSSGKIILELVFHVPGGILGALLISRVCDKMGRRLSFLVFLIASLTVGTMISSAQFFEAYVAFRLILGMSLTCLHLVNYIWIVEHFASSTRALANAAYDFTRLCCVPLLALLNSYVHSWNYLHLASTISLLTGILVYFAVPESPRWLLMKGNVEAAETVLKAVARRNDEQYPRRMILQYKPVEKTQTRGKCGCSWKYGVIIAIWVALHLACLFIKTKVAHFTDNINICEGVYATVGLPLILITGLYLCEKVGRRGTVILLTMLSLLCCGLTILPLHLTPSFSTPDMMPIAAVHAIFPALTSVMNLWIVELLPSVHRVCMYSLLLAIRHILLPLVPLLLPYIDYRYQSTSVILAVLLLLISLALATLIHETKGQDMLEVPPQDEVRTRGMTLIRETISAINIPIPISANLASMRSTTTSNANGKTDNVAEWRPLSPILF